MNLDEPVVFDNESTGTKNFAFLFPGIFFVLEKGHILVADDFDRDLHPDLVLEILSWFQSTDRNPNGAQLLCTLHNAAVLETLEKEELFLTEKSSDGARAPARESFRRCAGGRRGRHRDLGCGGASSEHAGAGRFDSAGSRRPAGPNRRA